MAATKNKTKTKTRTKTKPIENDSLLRVRLPRSTLDAIDRACTVGLFKRTRSQFVRDALEAYITKSGNPAE